MSRDTDRALTADPAYYDASPRITDESVLNRWMGMEIRKINEGVVRERKTLAVLLCEDRPSAETKKGETYYFHRETIADLGRKLPDQLHVRLRLPILFFLLPDAPDSCSCSDEAAFHALQALGEISTLRTFEQGKFWVAQAIAYAILRKYPIVIQVVMSG